MIFDLNIDDGHLSLVTMNSFILVHPNNRLTRIDNLTIPSIREYMATLRNQIKQIENLADIPTSASSSTKAKELDTDRVQRLTNFKKAELRYVSCYLKILTNLESICKSCQMGDSYDYEKEDEILNTIEEEMKNLKSLEKALSKSKTYFETDGASCKLNEELSEEQRRPSLVHLEQGLFEQVERLHL